MTAGLISADVLSRLAATIHARRAADAGASYTRQLLDAGAEKCARKFGEEAIETVIAGAAGSTEQLTAEAADVLFHLLVLLEARGIAFAEVATVLEGRMGTSGLDEKARRTS
jgi:phosphoribosyl-ATP pyrophosphohydrolase